MSEKYDGMRLFWDGSKFFTRQGRKIFIPESITSQMPKNKALDGELWYLNKKKLYIFILKDSIWVVSTGSIVGKYS